MKLQLLIQGFLLLVLVLAQQWLSSQIEQRSMRAAEERASVVGDGILNGLNTLMSTQVGDKDVISDEAARALFINKMGISDNLKEVRVVRGKGLEEFGPGLPQEQVRDDLDRAVLASGKPTYQRSASPGETLLRAVIPYIAYKEFRSSKCLKCHAVDEGSVVGAVNVTLNIQADIDSIRRINLLIWAGQGGLQVVLFFVIQAIVRRQLRQL
ncbi:MAG: hypothetical protein ACR2I0_02055, partial [Rhodoferax sp.]